MVHLIEVDESQRQLTLLALAHLSLARPGFDYAVREVARRFPGGESLYQSFKEVNSDLMPAMLEAVQACDAYFVATAKAWAMNDGRVVAENGRPIVAAEGLDAICDRAAELTAAALEAAAFHNAWSDRAATGGQGPVT